MALHDNRKATIQDLASNFYLTEQDVVNGLTRAEASVKRLSELNDYVNISIIRGELVPPILQNFDVVIASDMNVSEMIQINHFCRRQCPPIGFVAMDGFGLCGVVFVDYGHDFTVIDSNGEQPKSSIVEGITQVSEPLGWRD